MLLSFLLPKGGPIWAEIAAETIDKAFVGAAMYTIGHWDEVKKIHDDYMNNNLKTEEPNINPTQVINVFDVNK